MKHLIFIEGVSGVGKSTAVKQLTERLLAEEFQVAAHYEGDADSPLDLCWVAYLTPEEYESVLFQYSKERYLLTAHTLHIGTYCLVRYRIDRKPLYSGELDRYMHSKEFCYRAGNMLPLSTFTEVFCDLWRCYLKARRMEPDYEIFDASLVSHMTNDLMRGYHAAPEELAEHLSILLEVIQEKNPIIFYLYTDNVTKRIVEARHSRKQPPLTAKKLQFWEDRMRMDLHVLPKLSASVHYLNISRGDWRQALDVMFQTAVSER